MADPYHDFVPHNSGLTGRVPPSRVLGPDGEPYRSDAPEADFAVGHNIQFSSLLSSGFRAYWAGQYDEAMRHSREDAIAMRNDCWLMALLQERKLATASLPFRIEVDDERDPMQKAVQEGLLRVVRRIPNFRKMVMYLLEGIWYGRYASQVKWGWQKIKMPSFKDPKEDEERKCLVVKGHMPINGDKIGHHWDGTPYISVNAVYANTLKNADVSPSTSGAYALYLRGSWRWRYIVHTHEAVDADYFDASAADAVHGLGIRSVLFWLDWLRKEWLGNVADWCERTGLGIRLWYYQANNPASRREVEKAARESTDRTNIFIPRTPHASGKTPEGVEFVDTSSTGADLLLKLQQHIEEHQERYVIGQSLSGGRGEGDSLSGEGKAKLAKDTKSQIIQYDAANLGETLTTDLIRPIQWWTFREPEARAVNARLVFAVNEPEPEKLLSAVKTFVVDLGGKVRMSEVQSAIGLGAVHEGDDVISLESIRQQQGQGQPGAPGAPPGPGGEPPPGMPGMPPGAGAPPAAAGDQPAAPPGPGAPAPDAGQGASPPDQTPPPGTEDQQPQGGAPPAAGQIAAGLDDIAKKGEGSEGAVPDDQGGEGKAKGGYRHYQYLGKWQRAPYTALLGELDQSEQSVMRMLEENGVERDRAILAIGETRTKLERFARKHKDARGQGNFWESEPRDERGEWTAGSGQKKSSEKPSTPVDKHADESTIEDTAAKGSAGAKAEGGKMETYLDYRPYKFGIADDALRSALVAKHGATLKDYVATFPTPEAAAAFKEEAKEHVKAVLPAPKRMNSDRIKLYGKKFPHGLARVRDIKFADAAKAKASRPKFVPTQELKKGQSLISMTVDPNGKQLEKGDIIFTQIGWSIVAIGKPFLVGNDSQSTRRQYAIVEMPHEEDVAEIEQMQDAAYKSIMDWGMNS